MKFLRNLWKDEQGQDLIEYTLLMVFVGLAAVAIFIMTSESINQIWSGTSSILASGATKAFGS